MGINYAALERELIITDVISHGNSAEIMQMVKDNDPKFTELYTGNDVAIGDYEPSGEYDMGWLGYFVGKNTVLKKLNVNADGITSELNAMCRGLSNNK